MTACIITIGDEILLGQMLDTNSQWIAEQLSSAGISVRRMLSVGDGEREIINAITSASEELLILTGGLGPTSDDRTKDALCTHYKCDLVFNEEVFNRMREHFSGRPLADLERNRMQAMVPSVCTPILNMNGTAPGMLFEDDNRILVSMPGVPQEMINMMTGFVLPRLQQRTTMQLNHSFVMTAGTAESALAEKLGSFETQLPVNVALAYLPSLGRVKLRFTSARPRAELDRLAREAALIIGDAAFATGVETSLEKHIGSLLRESGKTIGTAESCTGGYIAHLITTVPGSSDYYMGSVISYSYELKETMLAVKHDTLIKHGAVSEQVVREMLAGLLDSLKVDYGIAVSGIAGPAGATPDKPVGTVWLAVGSKEKVKTRLLQLKGDRMRIIETTSVLGLDELRRVVG